MPFLPLPQVLRRVWCLFEIWKTVNYHDVDGLVVLAKDVDLLGLKVRAVGRQQPGKQQAGRQPGSQAGRQEGRQAARQGSSEGMTAVFTVKGCPQGAIGITQGACLTGPRVAGGKHACHALHDVADQYLVLIQATSFFHPDPKP